MIGPLLADINAGGAHRNEVIELLIDHQRQFLLIVGSLVAGNRSCSVHGDLVCILLFDFVYSLITRQPVVMPKDLFHIARALRYALAVVSRSPRAPAHSPIAIRFDPALLAIRAPVDR